MLIQNKFFLTHLSIAHIIVTNICVWFRFILEETFDSVKSDSSLPNNSVTNSIKVQYQSLNTTTRHKPLGRQIQCSQVNTQVSVIIERLSPYLHPCAIEYSIICVTLFYVIWYNVGRRSIDRIHDEQVNFNKTIKFQSIFNTTIEFN